MKMKFTFAFINTMLFVLASFRGVILDRTQVQDYTDQMFNEMYKNPAVEE